MAGREKIAAARPVNLIARKWPHYVLDKELNTQQELQFLDIRNNAFSALNDGICNISYGFFADKAIQRCHVNDNPIQCEKFPECARDGCDAGLCMNGSNYVYFDFGEPRPEMYHPSPISTRPPILVHREGQPVQGSFRDSISIVNPISEGVDNRRQF